MYQSVSAAAPAQRAGATPGEGRSQERTIHPAFTIPYSAMSYTSYYRVLQRPSWLRDDPLPLFCGAGKSSLWPLGNDTVLR
jgi:hypothetical protein